MNNRIPRTIVMFNVFGGYCDKLLAYKLEDFLDYKAD
jgi:hypothetical protein